jgi:hypothetical protein
MAAPSKPLFVPRVLWGALLASTFIYLYVLYTVARDRADLEPDPALLPALGAVALGAAVASFLLPAQMHRAAAKSVKLEVKEIPDPNASVAFRDQTPTIRVFADPDEVRKKAVALYHTPLILSLALSEAVAVFGLVLGFLGFDWMMVLPFFVTSWILFALRFPEARHALEPLEKAHDARLLVE